MNKEKTSILNAAVIIAALGYFVDIYDLVLFSIVRIPSLKTLGLEGQAAFDKGVLLLNMQMAGMLIGGIFWGVLGDKKGRLSVLFGSIFLYSIANLANSFVHTIEVYAVLRFVAGIGLAGELGAGITLVSEVLPKEKRGYGTMIVATVGVSGAILAGVVGEYLNWRTAYAVGGTLGLLLLVLRVSVYESGMFNQIKTENISRGNFFSLFTNLDRFIRYLKCILIGLPTWYMVGILITFSPEFAKALQITAPVSAAKGIMYCYAGLVLGDLASGFLSQFLKSRKKVVLIFLLLTALSMVLYYKSFGVSDQFLYWVCFALGLSNGYWAIFVTVAAEQFGTNLRATVATTVPNFVRGAVVPITLLFQYLKPSVGILKSGSIVAVICMCLATLAALTLTESFHKDLNYLE